MGFRLRHLLILSLLFFTLMFASVVSVRGASWEDFPAPIIYYDFNAESVSGGDNMTEEMGYTWATFTGTAGLSGVVEESSDFEFANSEKMIERNVSYPPTTLVNTPSGNMSVSFWIKPETWRAGVNDFVVSGYDGDGWNIAHTSDLGPDRVHFRQNKAGWDFCDVGEPVAGVWTHLTFSQWANGSLFYYENGSQTAQCGMTEMDSHFNFAGVGWAGVGGSEYDGLMDELAIWNVSLNEAEALSVFDYGDAGDRLDASGCSATIIAPDDYDNTSDYDVDFSYNWTGCSYTSCSLFDDRSGSYALVSLDTSPSADQTEWFNDTGYTADVSVDWMINCSDGVTSTWLEAINRTLGVDTTEPTITLHPNNNFDSTNGSQVVGSSDMWFNMTFADERDLFAWAVNMTAPNGSNVYSNGSVLLSGNTTFNFSDEVTLTGGDAGYYNIQVEVSDSHTATAINDYEVITRPSRIDFVTDDDLEIFLTSLDPSTSTFTKLSDKYSFDFAFDDTSKTSRTFTVHSPNTITYLPHSTFKAHFVISDGIRGNWLDFEGVEGSSHVTKVDDHTFTVTFDTDSKVLSFESIGGLNVIEHHFEWLFDNEYPEIIANISNSTTLTNPLCIMGNDTISSLSYLTWYVNDSVAHSQASPVNATLYCWDYTNIEGWYNFTGEVNDSAGNPTNTSGILFNLTSPPCVTNWVNTSWSAWTQIDECYTNNTYLARRDLTEYDTNSCAGTQTEYNVTQAVITTGTNTSGSHTSMNALDGVSWNVGEVGGSPALDFAFNFTGVTGDVVSMSVLAWYDGSVPHTVFGQMQDNTGSWINISQIPHTIGYNWYNFTFDNAVYRNGTVVRMRVYHYGVGVASHEMYIDYADLQSRGNETFTEFSYDSACDYCSDSETFVYGNWSDLASSCGFRDSWSWDTNYTTCANVTNISTDFYLNDTWLYFGNHTDNETGGCVIDPVFEEFTSVNQALFYIFLYALWLILAYVSLFKRGSHNKPIGLVVISQAILGIWLGIITFENIAPIVGVITMLLSIGISLILFLGDY